MKLRCGVLVKLLGGLALGFLLFDLYLASKLTEMGRTVEQQRCNCSTTLSETQQRSDSSSPTTTGKSHLHKLCVAVPFRDRFEELQVFVPYMSEFLGNQSLEYDILVLNQVDRFRFNRAALINVGYYQSQQRGCDYFVMHDVDLLPVNPALNYGYPHGGPYHVAAPQYHPKYNYSTFIGGILIVTMEQYRLVNGMSNKYWGWGLEDDEFYLRLKGAKLPVERPQNLTTNRLNTFRHIHDRRKRKRDTLRLFNQRAESRKRDRMTGLDNVKFSVDSKTPLVIGGWQCLVVNVLLECDTSLTPWCEVPIVQPSPKPK